MSTPLKTLALEEAVLNVLEKKVSDALKAQRTKVQKALEEADTERQAVRLPSGEKVAAISLVDPDAKADVDDEDAFVEWVAQHHPSEIVTRTVIVTEVTPAFRKTLLDAMNQRKAAEVVTEAGEIVEVPGIKLRAGTRTHSIRFEGGDAGRDQVAAAWVAKQFSHLTGLGELTAGGAE
ncbi:hypothetical protein [Streptomyces sp. NPDC056683]|uniref:hypothetical protein n=1 Tax=Streptomyces sp. NPDC056683 TaxID=3345910 RepID=UPI0036BEB491